jgi:hypothetical protein
MSMAPSLPVAVELAPVHTAASRRGDSAGVPALRGESPTPCARAALRTADLPSRPGTGRHLVAPAAHLDAQRSCCGSLVHLPPVRPSTRGCRVRSSAALTLPALPVYRPVAAVARLDRKADGWGCRPPCQWRSAPRLPREHPQHGSRDRGPPDSLTGRHLVAPAAHLDAQRPSLREPGPLATGAARALGAAARGAVSR